MGSVSEGGALEAWFWRIRDRLLGHRPGVMITSTFLRLRVIPEEFLAELGQAASFTRSGDGFSIWMAEAGVLEDFAQRLALEEGEVLARSKILASSGRKSGAVIGEMISIRGTNVSTGIELEAVARMRERESDLIFQALATEPVGIEKSLRGRTAVSLKTNLAAAARVRLPRGQGILVFALPPVETNGHAIWLNVAPAPQTGPGKGQGGAGGL